jgi:hypothetical protein
MFEHTLEEFETLNLPAGTMCRQSGSEASFRMMSQLKRLVKHSKLIAIRLVSSRPTCKLTPRLQTEDPSSKINTISTVDAYAEWDAFAPFRGSIELPPAAATRWNCHGNSMSF